MATPNVAKSKSSKNWLKEHSDDYYVKKAQEQGYRSRAAFKLIELNEKDKLIKPGHSIVDLGASPGGWSQIISKLTHETGSLIATDILEMDSLPGVTFIQGDFTEQSVLEQILSALNNQAADLVLSDMAPNISGIESVDQPKSMYLAELALDLAQQVLAPKGSFVVKVFQGSGFNEYLAQTKQHFERVACRKPKSSRARSKETFIVAKGFRG